MLDRGDSALVLGGGRVVEVVGRDEFVDGVDVVLIPDLFDVAAHHGLVFFRHRLSPFRQSPTIANVTIENVPGKCKRRKVGQSYEDYKNWQGEINISNIYRRVGDQMTANAATTRKAR